MSQVYPYNDDNLVYDLDAHQYIITYNGVLNGLAEDLYQYNMDVPTAAKFLERISKQVYRYIYQYAKLSTTRWVEYRLAKDEELREIIYQAILGQVEYYLASAGPLVALQTGLSIEKSKAIPLEELRGNRKIAESTEMILLNSGILYTGNYPYFPKELYRVGY
jgi:hypothetical protein